MAEKNSLWKNIRKKAEQNRRTGAKPKKPTAEMLRQERKIKAKKYPDGGPIGDDNLYNMQRALELGYTPDETGHWPSVDSETGMWLKSKEHPTAWMEYMHGYALNPEVQKQYQHPVVNPEGYFGENQLQYNKKAEGGFTGEDDDVFKSNQNQGSTVGKTSQDWLANWVQDPEFANRLNRNFPSSAGDLEKKIYGVKEARERASAANLKNINKVIPDIVSDIYDTQFLYNTNPEINTGLLSSYKSRLEDPKSIKALEKNLSTNPQGFTDEQGRIIITNEANTQYGPQSVGVHELIHKVSERDKTLDKLFRGKFQTPSQDRIDANYDKDEMYPFLMQMRFDNKFQPGEEITPERLKQIRDSGYRNHLFRYYNDDEISKYLNTLASNQTQAPIQYAAQGGYMYPDGGGINPGKQKAVASTTDVSVRALPEGLFEQVKANPPARQPQTISVVDKRKQNPITKKPINPNRDLVGGKFEDTIPIEIIKSSYKHGVDPATALSIGLLESRMGTTNPNVGHIMVDPYSDYMPGAEDMVLTIKEKQDYAKKLGYTDPLLQLQAYNGLGVLSNKRGEIGKSAYGLPIPKEGIDLRQNPLYGKKVKNVRDSVIMQSPDLVRLMNYYKPKMDGGYMYYTGGPMYYDVGGKVIKNIGAGAYGILSGAIGAVTGGATNKFMDKGYNYLQKKASKNFDPNDPDDVKWAKSQDQFSGYGTAVGGIGAGILTGNVQGAIGQTATGLNKAFQASDWASDDFKKWSNISSTAIGIGAGLAGGNLNSAQSASKIGQAATKFGSQASKISPYANQALELFGGNEQTLLQQGVARQEYLNSPEYLAMKEKQNQAYVNQGLSFAANGGPINNNLLTLQTGSMRKNINNYRRKYKEGGQVDVNDKLTQFGLHKIQNGGKHWQNPKKGVIVGNASVEEDEVLKFAEGGSANLSNAEYVYPDTVNDEFTLPMYKPNESLTDFELDKDGNPIPLDMTPAEFLIKEGTKGSPFRKINTLAKIRMNNAEAITRKARDLGMAINEQNQQNQQMMVEGALQYAAAGGKLNKDLEKILSDDIQSYVEADNYYAYGGYLPKDKRFNMPNSYAKGGSIHIKKSKRGTFTAAAKKHGKSVQEFARQVLANKGNYSSAMVKKANFARNAAKWKHAEGGPMDPPDKWSLPIASRSNVQQGSRNIITAGAGNNLPFTEQGTRIINEYDNGLPNDTSYSYMTPTENFFYNTGQNQPDGKPIMNYQGSNPNPNINDYLPKIKGLSRYAHGGPVVSNVPQDFDLYAQNRGGMMMANGGMMMPQDDSMSKQIATALQQGADPQQLLQQLIKSGMDPQQAQLIIEAIMGKMQTQAQVPTEAPMMAMGGTMYAPGGGVSNFQHIKNMLLNKTYRNAYNLAKGYNTIKPKDYPNLFTPIEGEKTGPTGNFGEWAGFYPATEDEAKKYQGYDPTKVNQSTSTSSLGTGTGNENIFGDDKLGKALAIGQAAIPLGEAAYHIFNKPKHIKAPVIQPATVDYSASRIIDQRQTDMAENAYLNRLRNSSSTSGMFANNAKEYLLQSNAAQAGRNAISVQDQMNKNAEETARANALNAQYGFSADQLNYDIDQARIGNIFGALNNAATTGFQGYSDISNRKLQEIQARSTQSANVTPITGTDGRIYMATKGADGYYFNGVKIAELPK